MSADRQRLRDQVYMRMTLELARLGTCPRRQVACILLDKRHQVLATGYNGGAAGEPHCIDEPCPGAGLPSGTGLDVCEAIHAEENALLQCADVWKIRRAYVKAFPCVGCIKKLLNTGCRVIVYHEDYPHGEAYKRWARNGRKAIRIGSTD